MEHLTDGIKKLLLAGLGAAAVTTEKAHDLLDELVERGELTIEQGKALNEELKHSRQKDKEAEKEETTDTPEE